MLSRDSETRKRQEAELEMFFLEVIRMDRIRINPSDIIDVPEINAGKTMGVVWTH